MALPFSFKPSSNPVAKTSLSSSSGFSFRFSCYQGQQKSYRVPIQNAVKRSPKRLKYRFSSTRKVEQVLQVSVDVLGSDVWKLEPVIRLLKDGAVGVIPTDTVYAIVCDLQSPLSIDRIYRIKDMDPKKPLSILCRSFQDIDFYTTGFPRGDGQGHKSIFRAARQCFPGPYTFILPASKELPKQCTNFGENSQSCVLRKNVGVRMPNDAICQAILKELDSPLISTSVRRPADDDWMLDPFFISDTYGASKGKEGVDFIVDGGIRVADPSTVVDMTGLSPVILRHGKGVVKEWMLMEVQSPMHANPYA